MDRLKFRQECRDRWRDGRFLEHNQSASVGISQQTPWTPYETYMRAQIIQGVSGHLGVLIVKFPADSSEDNAHHCHPQSDRRITVIQGGGTFEFFSGNILQIHPLHPGDRVWMPRGVLHTFRSGQNGLLVESLHNPFLAFDHPHCLVYPKKKVH
jgi:quercetin dioxygenase-like cupin family protein